MVIFFLNVKCPVFKYWQLVLKNTVLAKQSNFSTSCQFATSRIERIVPHFLRCKARLAFKIIVNIFISSFLGCDRNHHSSLIMLIRLVESQEPTGCIWHSRWNLIYHHISVISKIILESFELSLVFMKKKSDVVTFQFSFAFPEVSGELTCSMWALYGFRNLFTPVTVLYKFPAMCSEVLSGN